MPGYPLAWTHAKASALLSVTHKHTCTWTHTVFGFCHNPQTGPHLHMPPHTLSILHTQAFMLMRLIISQVCHLIFIWASEVLTSISLSSSSFSLICHLSVFITFFSSFPSLSLFAFFFSNRHCWGKGFIGCVLCQIQWKTARDKGVRMRHCTALKSDRNKGVWGFFVCFLFLSGDCCKFYSRKIVSANLQHFQWCGGEQKGVWSMTFSRWLS